MTTPESPDVQQPAHPDERIVQLYVVVEGSQFPIVGFDTLAELQAAVRAAIDEQTVLELRTRDDERGTVGVVLLVGAQLDAVAVLGLMAPPLSGRPGID